MAKANLISLYEQIQKGKRVVSVTTRDLPAVRMWLWYNGYKYKSNRMGDTYNLMIEKK